NRAGGLAPTIDWRTAIDGDETGAFTPGTVTVLGRPIDLHGDELSVNGEIVTLSLAGGFVSGSGKFSLTKGTASIDLDGNNVADVAGASLFTVGLSEFTLRVGDRKSTRLN